MSRFVMALAGVLLLGAGVQAPVAVDGQRSRVNGQRSTVNSQRSTVHSPRSTVNGQRTTVIGQPSTVDRRPSTIVPAPWLTADPADSLYRAAREALNHNRYREALDTFRELERRYPRSGYVADGLYWQAFALYRLGGRANLQRARSQLDEQKNRFPAAATRGDADALAVRISSALVQYGDASADEALYNEARLAQTAPPAPPRAPHMPPSIPAARLAPAPGMGDDDCGSGDDAKAMALQGIMRNNPERAVPILEKVLARRDPESVCLRRHALFVLASSNNPAGSRLLLQAVSSDPDKEVREGAVFWLAQTHDPKAVALLDSVLKASTDEDVQQAAMFALSTKRDPEARRVMKSYLNKPGVSPDVAGMALFQLARDPETTPAELKQYYANASSTEMKSQVLVAMMTRRDKDTDWLMSIATNKNEDHELRQQALMAMVQSGMPTAELLKVFDAIPPDDEMQGMMMMLMAQRPNDPAIVDRLMSIARSSKNKEMQQQAIFWLSQSKDPRATKLLEEILEQ